MTGCSLSFPSFLPSGIDSLYEFPNTDIQVQTNMCKCTQIAPGKPVIPSAGKLEGKV
jgi:hypothetical protein